METIEGYGIDDGMYTVKVPVIVDHDRIAHMDIDRAVLNEVPQYSLNEEDMATLEWEMYQKGYYLELFRTKGSQFHATFSNTHGMKHSAESPLMPMAVAKAAYKTLTGKDWVDAN